LIVSKSKIVSTNGTEKDGEIAALNAYFEAVSHSGMPEIKPGGNTPFQQEHSSDSPFSTDNDI
jgi:hypothetical protein